MKIVRGSRQSVPNGSSSVIAIGNFDGIHLGHKKIIEKTISLAGKDGISVIYTLEPHPAKLLIPELAPPLLQTQKQKERMFERLGVEILIIEPFTKEFAVLKPRDFFRSIIKDRLMAREIVVGYDFTFGFHRLGKISDLKSLAERENIKVHVVDAVFVNEMLVSSTHIRILIERGDIETANTLLGRAYSIIGKVVKGRGVGQTLGFHTANLDTRNELIPPPGVYITKTQIWDKEYPSVTNIGFNPTFGTGNLSIETHILDFEENILEKEIEIEFYKKIRNEMTFPSVNDLREEIKKDILEARRFYGGRKER